MKTPLVRALMAYIDTHYNRVHHIVDVQSLAKQPELQQFRKTINFNDTTFVTSLLKALQIKARLAVGLVLDENRLKTLCTFSQLSNSLPHLTQLSLKNNVISLRMIILHHLILS